MNETVQRDAPGHSITSPENKAAIERAQWCEKDGKDHDAQNPKVSWQSGCRPGLTSYGK